MQISQNARFFGDVQGDPEFPDPPGAAIARLLESGVRSRGWTVSAFDNWRDVGWIVVCERPTARLQVALATLGPGEWLLQVSPLVRPGPFARLLGRVSSATADDCLQLARAVHFALIESQVCTRVMWSWDAKPQESTASAEPQESSAAR